MTDGKGGMGQKRLVRAGLWAGVIGSILLVPLVAMQFTDDVKWTPFDFVFIGGLMAGVATAYELAAHRGAPLYRAGVGVALATAFLLLWINGAVGVIGSEDEPPSLLLVGVIAIAVTGSLLARFRSTGMAIAMLAAGVVQLAVGVAALATGWGDTSASWPYDVVVLNSVFAAMWMAAAWLFRMAARR